MAHRGGWNDSMPREPEFPEDPCDVLDAALKLLGTYKEQISGFTVDVVQHEDVVRRLRALRAAHRKRKRKP